MANCVILKDAFLSVDGTDLSAFVQSLTVDAGSDTQNPTTMGDDTLLSCGSLLTWSISADMINDETTVGATLFPINGTTVTVIIRREASLPVSASNPNYTGDVAITGIPIISGSVGDLNAGTLTGEAASTLARTIV